MLHSTPAIEAQEKGNTIKQKETFSMATLAIPPLPWAQRLPHRSSFPWWVYSQAPPSGLIFHSFPKLFIVWLFPSYFFFLAELWYVKSWFPNQGSNPRPLQWKCGVLTTGLLRKSPFLLILVVPGFSVLMSLSLLLTITDSFLKQAKNTYKTLPISWCQGAVAISNHEYPIFTAHTFPILL